MANSPLHGKIERFDAEPAVDEVTATDAYILYGSNVKHVSHHDVKAGTVGPGKWVDAHALLRALDKVNRPAKAKREAKAEAPVWLPYHILSIGSDELCWHVPAAKRRLNFTEPRMRKLSGELQLPAMLFKVQGRSLHLAAIPDDAIPAPDTPLYQAPFPNTYKGGGLCHGTMKKYGHAPADAAKWTDAFFDSAFTHFTYFKYWQAVKAGKSPALKPMGKTLKEL